ncbi:MAG: sigma-70 family RNA polymerase sigma factor [Armatimonadetes bacterium]|nr:sigma-70 family RNA polymerase sigma factor [Armatimonadota bacterium]
MERKSYNSTQIANRDSQLVHRAQRGESVAFEILADQYRPAIFAQAMRMLRNHEDAHDAVQETLLKACKALHTFDTDRPMLPWLLRICSNCCVDTIRNRKKSTESLDAHEYNLMDDNSDVEADFERSQSSDILQSAINRLPSKYREILEMRHYRHMDVNEIAEHLGKPEGTVKSWLFRARAMLRKDLTPAMIA